MVVLDPAIAPNAPLAARARFTFVADHQSILGFSATEKGGAADAGRR